MSARRPWYKRFPADFRAATASLPYYAKGTYSHVLDLIYDHGGPIDDKPSDIARALGCDRHTWRNHRAVLLKAKKLFVKRGKLFNKRAAKELGGVSAPIATNASAAGENPTTARDTPGEFPHAKISRTKTGKRKRRKALNGATAHPEKDTYSRSQIQTPFSPPLEKGGAKTGRSHHGKKPKSRRDDIIAALAQRRAERERRGGGRQGGGGDPQ